MRSSTKSKSRPTSQASKPKIDRRRRTPSAAIDAPDRREIFDAFAHAQRISRTPTCTIDFHPIHMDAYPDGEIGLWFKDELRNRITTWLRRRHINCYAIWIRENYAGERREHLHLMIFCPIALRADLEAAIRRWYPGNPEMVRFGQLNLRKHPRTGFVTCSGLEYRLKQMTVRAWGPPRRNRPRRETKSRYDGAPIAPVLGRRFGVSRTLERKAREAWQQARDAIWDARREVPRNLAPDAA